MNGDPKRWALSSPTYTGGMGMRPAIRGYGNFPNDTPSAPPSQWTRGPQQEWGYSADSDLLDGYEKHVGPADSAEVIRTFDVQRCIAVDPAVLNETGVAFELVRYSRVPSFAVGIVERVPTVIESAVALDGSGDPQYVYTGVNGENPCLHELVHPHPGVNPLDWTWRLTTSAASDLDQQPTLYQGPVSALAIAGEDLVLPWTDMRYGHAGRWADDWQLIVNSQRTIRVWVVLRAPANRYRLTLGARLSGYLQFGGRRGAALDAALRRTV